MLHTFNTSPDIHSDFCEMLRFSNAFEVWMTFQQNHCIRVDRAAQVWNVSPQDILDAADCNPYLVVESRGYTDIRRWVIGHGDP